MVTFSGGACSEQFMRRGLDNSTKLARKQLGNLTAIFRNQCDPDNGGDPTGEIQKNIVPNIDENFM